MRLKDDNAVQLWEKTKSNNKDSYGLAIIQYIERLVHMLENRVVDDRLEITKEQWIELSHKADIDGITGFQYSYAKKIINELWFLGDVIKKFG